MGLWEYREARCVSSSKCFWERFNSSLLMLVLFQSPASSTPWDCTS